MCLFEATNVSEGRGTTRPFHLVGAPWIDPQALVAEAQAGAARAGLEGVLFRPAAFVPTFQKFAGQSCQGLEVHVVDRRRVNGLLLGMVVLEACRSVDPRRFAWRTEPYEFVSDIQAIDLLTGSAEYRLAIDGGRSVRGVLDGWEPARRAFLEKRAEVSIY
jgi:uncharacterized protein YbbC (DUF1343 family)